MQWNPRRNDAHASRYPNPADPKATDSTPYPVQHRQLLLQPHPLASVHPSFLFRVSGEQAGSIPSLRYRPSREPGLGAMQRKHFPVRYFGSIGLVWPGGTDLGTRASALAQESCLS